MATSDAADEQTPGSLPALSDQSNQEDDHTLVRDFRAGHARALEQLIDRYDRLVRYTIHRYSQSRCRADPQWLDSVASQTWLGFVSSVNKAGDDLPGSIQAYLVQTARNKTISAIRTASRRSIPISSEAVLEGSVPDALPDDIISRFEQAEILRNCLAALSDDDRRIAGQLEAITDRRWREAASSLGMPESTLRSRWKKILEQLRRCVGE